MVLLAIESSCDETAAAVVEDRTVLSSLIASQIDEHALYGGVVPEIASRRHIESVGGLTRAALLEAGLSIPDLDGIAVTYAPGLIGALLVGLNFAKGMAFAAGKPLIPVHHLRAHIAANYIAYPGLTPPFLSLVVSGGHSHIVEVTSYTGFRVAGRTRDDAAGECFDKTARALGLPYPGGVHLDKVADEGDAERYTLPHPTVEGAEYDFSFSGLKTAVINRLHNAEQKGELIVVQDMAAAIRRRVCDMLVNNIMKAAGQLKYRTIALSGGVAANSELRRRMTEECAAAGIKLYMPPLSLCGDNAAMVGVQGIYEYQAGHVASTGLNAYATMPIDALSY